MRICVFRSPDHDSAHPLAKALSYLRRCHPGAVIDVLLPEGADEGRTHGASTVHYYRHAGLTTVWSLLRRLRVSRYDLFVVLFPSSKLRLLAASCGAARKAVLLQNGRLVPLTDSLPRAFFRESFLMARGRTKYWRAWLSVHVRHVSRT